MSANKEKDILNGIKQSVEAETPDVWEGIQSAEKYKYNFHEKPLNAKVRNKYLPVMAAAALCVVVTLGGMKHFQPPTQNNELVAQSSGQNSGREIIPSIAPVPADSKNSTSQFFDPFTKDADVKEASKAFNINIVEPTWMPQGFTKVSAKLYSNDKDGKQPYMYNIEYKNGSTLFAVTVMKNMTEEEKLKAQPAPMPEPAGNGDAGLAASSGAAVSGPADMPPLPPDTPVSSKPSDNQTEPAAPTTAPAPSAPSISTDKPSDTPAQMPSQQGGNTGSGSSGSTGSTPGSKPVSVQLTNTKINNIEVSMTVVDSSKKGALSAYWIYEGGTYSIYTDGIAKEDMVKIIESMIK